MGLDPSRPGTGLALSSLGRPASDLLPSLVTDTPNSPDMEVLDRKGRRAMRDPLARWASTGLILALPFLIYVATATSVAAPPEEPQALALAGVLGPIEA